MGSVRALVVVEGDPAPFAVHRDLGSDPFQPVRPDKGRKLAALISIRDLGRAELVDRLIKRLHAEVSLQRCG